MSINTHPNTSTPVSRVLLACAMSLLVALHASAVAAADAVAPVLKLSVGVGPAFALGKAAEQWSQAIAEDSGGTLNVRVFPGATLAGRDPLREMLALRDGTADLAVGSSLAWSAQVKELGAASLPWIAPTTAQLAALASAPLIDRWRAALASHGVVLLAVAPLGHRVLLATTDRVHDPADLAGLRVRSPAIPMLTDLYVALNARPTWLGAAAAREAAATGALDAEDGTVAALAAARVDALGFKYLTVWGATGELALFAVNGAAWSGLSESQRSALRETARAAATALGTLAREEEDRALDALRQRGVTITRLLAPSQAAFADVARPMRQQWTDAIGADLVREVEAASRNAAP